MRRIRQYGFEYATWDKFKAGDPWPFWLFPFAEGLSQRGILTAEIPLAVTVVGIAIPAEELFSTVQLETYTNTYVPPTRHYAR